MEQIKKIYMNCPLCGKTHEVEERTRLASIIIKDEEVKYQERYYICTNSKIDENEFENGTITNENLLNARNAYRLKMGLLTSNEIVAIREEYGLSQVDLAKLLGWGEATISRYESKAIQDDAYDLMLRLIKDDPEQALELLKKNGDNFSETKRLEIRTNIINKLETHGKEYLSRRALESEYANFYEPSDSNGLTILNIDKTEAIISYIAEKTPNLFKVKLMKMLWYCDCLSFKLQKHSITGLVYRHDSMGALPIGHYRLMNLENINAKEEIGRNYETMLHIYPTLNMNYSILNKKEISIIDKVIKKFKDYSTKDIVEYMHKESAYTKTNQGDIIPFSLANEIDFF